MALTASTNGNRFSPQPGVIKLFNRCKKSIHIDMDDLSHSIYLCNEFKDIFITGE